MDQCLHAVSGRIRRVAQVGIPEIPVREHPLVVAGGIFPGEVKALVQRLAGEVINAQVFPAAVLLNAVLMVLRRVAGQPVDPDVLDLQRGIGQGAARLVGAGPFATLDAVIQDAVDAVEVDAFQVDRPATESGVADELYPEVGSRRHPHLASDPDDIMPALDEDRIGQHDRILKDVVLADAEVHDDDAVVDVAVAERLDDGVRQRRWAPGERPRGRVSRRRKRAKRRRGPSRQDQ